MRTSLPNHQKESIISSTPSRFTGSELKTNHYIPGTFWFGRFDVERKMVQIEEANAGIAIATPRLDDEDMDHFSPQKSARIKHIGYTFQKSIRYQKRNSSTFSNLMFGVLIALVWFLAPASVSGQLTCETFNFTGGLQSFTVPAGVTSVRVLAAGAKGGNETLCGACSQGGLGAIVSGDFSVTPGEIIQIIAGGRGVDDAIDAGGGGASFVARGSTGFTDFTAANILMIAGGGGGADLDDAGQSSSTFQATATGPGGSNGGGNGGGGGSAGSDGQDGGSAQGGHAAINGAAGGAGSFGANGGFGGGGGGFNSGGGGGGATGGNAGSSFAGGRAGTSYNGGANPVNTPAANSGHGYVIISYGTPEPLVCRDISTQLNDMGMVEITPEMVVQPPAPDASFAFTGALQSLVIPMGVTSVRIEAAGARGGMGGSNAGGEGAFVSGDFMVTSGQTIQIIVGGMGSGSVNSAGGGGASFVTEGAMGFADFTDAKILLIAGGGGGGNFQNGGHPSTTFQATANGSGGNNGFGAAGGGGSAGSNGADAVAQGGFAAINGAAGGAGYFSGGNGGFGSGGGGDSGGGGGGGATGGNAGSSFAGGGAGTSYNGGENPANIPAANSGHGYVNVYYNYDLANITVSPNKLDCSQAGMTTPIIVTRTNCDMTTTTCTAMVTLPPKIIANDASLTECETEGGNANFMLEDAESDVNNSPGVTYTYYDNEDATAPAISSPYTAMDGTIVYVVVTDGQTTCTDTAAITLNVTPAPDANDVVMVECERSNGEALFDLTNTTTLVNPGGGVTYTYYEEATATTLITDSMAYSSAGSSVYVVVTDPVTTCTDTASITLIVTPAPEVDCPDDIMIAECMTQAKINAEFADWLDEFGNDCPDCEETDLSAFTAPDSCGGMTEVKYVVNDLCGTPKDSCTRTFEVMSPMMIAVTCPEDMVVNAELSDPEIMDAFDGFLNSIQVMDGCKVSVEHDGTLPVMAGYCEDGVTIVNWEITSTCDDTMRCTATFTISASRGGEDPPNCNNVSPSVGDNGEIILSSPDFLTNPDHAKYPATVTVSNQWGGVIRIFELIDKCTIVSWNICNNLGDRLDFSVTSTAGMCSDGVINLSGIPPLFMTSAYQSTVTRTKAITGRNISEGKINVYCGHIPDPSDHVPMVTDPCTGKPYTPQVQPDWVMPIPCDEVNDMAEVIFRTWEVFDKEGNLSTLTDTIVVFRLPKLTPEAFVGAAEDSLYCDIDSVFNEGESIKQYASWRQPVGLHDYELPYSKLRGVTYEIPAMIIIAGLENAAAQGPDVLEEYLDCVILRKADGEEVTIGNIVSGDYMASLIANATQEQLSYGFLQALIELNEKPVNVILEIIFEFYPYLLLQDGDWILTEGGNFEQVDAEWFYNGNGNSPYWFAGGWPSIYGSGDCVSYCDMGDQQEFGCIKIQIPLLNAETGFDPELCDTICLPTGVHCGITIKQDPGIGEAPACPQTKGLDTWITQTCWAETPNHCADDSDLPCEELSADENEEDAVVDYSCTDKSVKVQLSQWQTLYDTIGPIFDFCYPTVGELGGVGECDIVGGRCLNEADWDPRRIRSAIRAGRQYRDARRWEFCNPTVYRVSSHDCAAEIFVPSVKVIDNCSGVHSVKAMVEVAGGTRSVALEQTGVETRLITLTNGDVDTCRVYTYEHLTNPIRLPFSGCDGEVTQVRYEAADNCWNQSIWNKFIQMTDDVPPTVVTDRAVTVPLQNKIAWVQAETFDEGSWDNCAIDLKLVRRTDWWADTACVNLCEGVGPNAPYDNWIDLLEDLGIDRNQAITAIGGGVVCEEDFNSAYNVDDLATFLNEGEVEEYYFDQIVWLWTDGQLCGQKAVHGWLYDLASYIAQNCSAADEHGNLLKVKDLEAIFDNLMGKPGYGKELALLGGGWGKSVPFKCEDACEEVTVELVVFDYCCNWGKGWATAHVEDKGNARLVKRLPDLDLTCEAYNTFYKDIVVNAAALGVNGSENDSNGAFAALDSALGHYVKTWVDNQDRPTDIDGNLLPDSELNFDYHSIACEEKSETEKVAVERHDGTIDWVTEVTKTTFLDTTTHTGMNGIVGINCAASCIQDVWVDLDECGQGTITRRFTILGGCGPTHRQAQGPPEWTVEQVITVKSACGMRESMFDLPANVGTNDAPICLPQALSNGYLPDTIGAVSLKAHLDGSLCNSVAIGKDVKELDVLGAAGMKKYVIDWTVIDWCAPHTSTNREFTYTQEVIATIDADCDITIDTTGVDTSDVSLVDGVILTEAGEAVNKVEMTAVAGTGSPLSTTTEIEGTYSFTINNGSQVSLIPGENTGFANGISTQDLIDIQRHVLQKKALDSKYKRIAADVNGNGTIDGLDILELRKLVMNPDSKFANNTSWRFFETQTDKEKYEINNLTSDQTVDWVGVKIGDVNLSGDPARGRTPQVGSDRSAQDQLHLNIADKVLKGGEVYRVEVRSDNFDDIRGMQYTLGYADAYVSVESIEPGVLNVTPDHYLKYAPGVITASWNEADGVSVGADEVLFTIVLKAKSAAVLRDVLSLSDRITPTEAYNASGELKDLALHFDGMDSGFALYQNTPNPYQGETVIGFKLPAATAATMTIYDVTGRMIKRIEGEYEAGYNEVRVASKDLGTTGVLYYQLDTDEFTATKKMIIVK